MNRSFWKITLRKTLLSTAGALALLASVGGNSTPAAACGGLSATATDSNGYPLPVACTYTSGATIFGTLTFFAYSGFWIYQVYDDIAHRGGLSRKYAETIPGAGYVRTAAVDVGFDNGLRLAALTPAYDTVVTIAAAR